MAARQVRKGRVETKPRAAAAQTEVRDASREPAESQSVIQPNAEQPFIDYGPSVPESYDIDIVRAVVQDPFRVFVYWEISEQSITALAKYFWAAEPAFQIVLVLIEIGGPEEVSFDVARQGSYWMMVLPDRDYEFELRAHSPKDGYISLMRSNRVHTPNGTISRVAPEEAEYRLSPQEFTEVVEASGFTGNQALLFMSTSIPASTPQFQVSAGARASSPVGLPGFFTLASETPALPGGSQRDNDPATNGI